MEKTKAEVAVQGGEGQIGSPATQLLQLTEEEKKITLEALHPEINQTEDR